MCLVGASVKGLWESMGMVRGGCRRCGNRGLGRSEGAGCLRRRSGGNREEVKLLVEKLLKAAATDSLRLFLHRGVELFFALVLG